MPDVILSPHEIRRRLRMIAATDPAERQSRAAVLPGIHTVAIKANTARSFLHRIITGEQLPGPDACRKLSAVLLSLKD